MILENSLDSISAVFLIKNDGSLLLQLRDNIPTIHRPGYWVVPGGHCEKNESCEECAYREFFEETQYRCSSLNYLGTVQDNADGYLYWLNMYWCLYDETQQIRCMEGQEVKFVKRTDGADYIKIDILLEYWDKILDSFHATT